MPKVDLGEREIVFPCSLVLENGELQDVTVDFDGDSTINFSNKLTNEIVMRLQPSDLSVLYGSYMQMIIEQSLEKE